jgi:hypothetical protein
MLYASYAMAIFRTPKDIREMHINEDVYKVRIYEIK